MLVSVAFFSHQFKFIDFVYSLRDHAKNRSATIRKYSKEVPHSKIHKNIPETEAEIETVMQEVIARGPLKDWTEASHPEDLQKGV